MSLLSFSRERTPAQVQAARQHFERLTKTLSLWTCQDSEEEQSLMDNIQVWTERRKDRLRCMSHECKGGEGLRLLTDVARMLARGNESVACTGKFSPMVARSSWW